MDPPPVETQRRLPTAAAVLLCIVILGMSVSVLATASDAFREWLFDMFSVMR